MRTRFVPLMGGSTDGGDEMVSDPRLGEKAALRLPLTLGLIGRPHAAAVRLAALDIHRVWRDRHSDRSAR